MPFDSYIKMARKTVKPERMTDAALIADYVGSNLKLCGEAVRHAERMNWGAHAHLGLRTLVEIKALHAELDSRPLSVTEDELRRVCRLRQLLCDTMWRSEHHV